MSDLSYDIFATRFGYGAVVAGSAGVAEVFLPFGNESAAGVAGKVAETYPGVPGGGELSRLAAEELKSYCAGEAVNFTAPLDLSRLTPFQLAVCRQVLAIGYGRVCSYGEVARRAGSPGAARGVGTAMAANRLPILVPCHRVVAADGGLTGYSGCGGIASKRILLQMEGVVVSSTNRVMADENFKCFAQKSVDRVVRGK